MSILWCTLAKAPVTPGPTDVSANIEAPNVHFEHHNVPLAFLKNYWTIFLKLTGLSVPRDTTATDVCQRSCGCTLLAINLWFVFINQGPTISLFCIEGRCVCVGFICFFYIAQTCSTRTRQLITCLVWIKI